MKVKQEKPPKVFTPVTITLETQEEVDVLVAIMGKVGGGVLPTGEETRARKFVNSLYYDVGVLTSPGEGFGLSSRLLTHTQSGLRLMNEEYEV